MRNRHAVKKTEIHVTPGKLWDGWNITMTHTILQSLYYLTIYFLLGLPLCIYDPPHRVTGPPSFFLSLFPYTRSLPLLPLSFKPCLVLSSFSISLSTFPPCCFTPLLPSAALRHCSFVFVKHTLCLTKPWNSSALKGVNWDVVPQYSGVGT